MYSLTPPVPPHAPRVLPQRVSERSYVGCGDVILCNGDVILCNGDVMISMQSHIIM